MADHQTLTVEEAFSTGEPVLLFNPTYNEYVFVSDDKKDNDNVVESHPYRDEARNQFVLQKTGDSTGLLFNPTYGRWLFVSNDRADSDHIVEAHQFKDEERNKFNFQSVEGNKYRIFNPKYNEYIFVSNDKEGPDHVVESHPNSNEARNEFQLVMAENLKVTQIEYLMEQSKIIEEMEPMVMGRMSCPNETSIVQTMTLNFSKTMSVETTYTYSRGFRIEGTATFTGGVPNFLGTKYSVSVETSHNWSNSTTNTSSVKIEGTMTVNCAPNALTEAECQMKLQKIKVPYKMTLVSKNGNEFLSYGDYQGVSFLNIDCKPKQKLLP